MSLPTVSTAKSTARSVPPASPSARTSTSRFWRRDIFDLVALACVCFVVLTGVAMLLYPGGTILDPGSQGYRFFENYFSDLGLTHSRSGAVNLPAMLCFIAALVSVALALFAFFLAFTQFFSDAPRALRLSRRAAVFGGVSCVGFIGIAASPRDLAYLAHVGFELVAFPSLLVAVVLEIAALRALERITPPGSPRRFLWVFTWVFAVFAVALTAYIALLAFGPDESTLVGEHIDVTSQKLIVYAALATVFLQSILASRWTRQPKE